MNPRDAFFRIKGLLTTANLLTNLSVVNQIQATINEVAPGSPDPYAGVIEEMAGILSASPPNLLNAGIIIGQLKNIASSVQVGPNWVGPPWNNPRPPWHRRGAFGRLLSWGRRS